MAFWSQDYSTATDLYRQLLAQDPSDLELQEALASALLWSGDRRAALTEFTTLLQRDPRQQELWIRFLQATSAASELTAQQLRLVTTIEDQIDALPLATAHEIREELVAVYLAHEQHSQAIQVLKSLLATAPGDPELKAQYAVALIGVGKIDQALPMLVGLVSDNPSSRELRRKLAYAYASSQQDEQANAEFSLLIAREQDRDSADFARLLLGAASVSKRLQRTDEARERYAEALQILSQLLEQNETNVDLWQPFLDAAAGSYQFPSTVGQQIIHIYDQRDRHDPTKAFLTRIADVMSILDRPRDVLPILRRLTQRYPDDHEIEGRLANVYISLDEFDQALPLLQRLAKRVEPQWKWQTELAHALHAAHLYDQAEQIYVQQLATPDYPEEFRPTLLLAAARNSVALKQLDTAKSRFEQRRELVDGLDRVDDEYAGVLLQLGDADRVVELLANRERTIGQRRVLASAHEMLAEIEPARELYAEILAEAPHDDGAARGLARLALAERDFPRAIELYSALLTLHPEDENLQFDLGIAYLSSLRYAEATQTFFELLDSEIDRNRIDLAYLQAAAGQTQLSAPQLQAVTRIQQRLLGAVDIDMQLLVSLADVLLRVDQPHEVVRLTEPYVIKPDQSDEIAKRYAHALLGTGRASEAKDIYHAWLINDPQSDEAKYMLALAHQALEQYVASDGYFRELLRLPEPLAPWYLGASDTADGLGQQKRGIELASRACQLFLQQFTSGELARREWPQLIRAINKSQSITPAVQQAVQSIYEQATADMAIAPPHAADAMLVDLAHALLLLGNSESANRIIDFLSTSDLTKAGVAEKYADLLCQLGRYRQALPIYRELHNQWPQRSLYAMQCARTLYNMADYAHAADCFDQVLAHETWGEQVSQRHVDFLLSAADANRRLGRVGPIPNTVSTRPRPTHQSAAP